MARLCYFFLITLFAGSTVHHSCAQTSSILATGEWIKLGISQQGIYKITYDDLQAMGYDTGSIDPARIAIYGNGGGMLPQANDSARVIDLEEIAIHVVFQQQGKFSSGDYILFYGEGPDYLKYDKNLNLFNYQKHLFSTVNYYFLTVKNSNGTRISTATAPTAGPQLTSAYKVYIHESELVNILHSGRRWFGEKFDLTLSQTFPTGMANLKADGEIKIVSSVMSTSTDPSEFEIRINNQLIGTQTIAANPSGTYAKKGSVDQGVFTTSQSVVGNDELAVTYNFNKNSGAGYLDYFVLQAEQLLQYNESPLIFYPGDHTAAGNRSVIIENCPTGLLLWDISDQASVNSIPFTQVDGRISFNLADTTNALALFDPTSLPLPVSSVKINNQNLHGISKAELLIVSPDEVIEIANQIADLRNNQGITTVVVTPEMIYNEFSSGKQDISAIRDFAKLLYENASLAHLLIFGKGTYDPKDIVGSGLSKIPIYESRNSLSPLATYASDDYLGFFEDHEGEWPENNSDDHTMEIGVGRIPVTNYDEASGYLQKLKAYQDRSALGQWRQDVVFVAENGDLNIHQRDAERLSTLIDTTYAGFSSKKIYVDAFKIEVNPGFQRAPEANTAIYEAINQGALIVNYTGHGNESQWANTRIFDKKVIDSLQNTDYLPLFVTATCEFGRHDDTGARSGGEELLVKNDFGAIATITTARPVFASSNYQLNLAFYQAVFQKQNGKYQQLGDIFKSTKNNSLSGVLNRNFSLLGDPSMKLSYGDQFITIDSLNGQQLALSDTLASLQELHFSGSIRNTDLTIDNNFYGVINLQILDKQRTIQTLGNLGASPFSYKLRDNKLFAGTATVVDGRFEFTTVLPLDVSYKAGNAKVIMYASQSDSALDASGANIDMLIGSSTASPISDNDPPEIALFLGDTTYQEGMIVSPNTLLIVRLSDEYGINTSNSQIGHSITYTLDNGNPVVLNNFYVTDRDDFRSGWLYVDLPEMRPGSHKLKVKAWDTSNNSSIEKLEFQVSEVGEVRITNLSNYPNPMSEQTRFTFTHNLAGEDIEVRLEIINPSGQKIYNETRSYFSAPTVIDDWEWDGRNRSGGKLNDGLYIFGIFIRSTSSKLAQQQYSRLFITN